MAFSRYNAKDEVVTVGGVHITGLAEDFWSFEKRESLAEDEVGAQGDVVRNESNDPLYDATITVQNTSPQIKYLRSLAKETVPFPIWRTNKSLGITEGGSQALLSEIPSSEAGTTAGESEFKFTVYDGETITD